MKSINLQFEELGPWMKLSTPPITPIRKILPFSTTANHHKRAATTMLQDKRCISTTKNNPIQEDSFAKYYKEHGIPYLPTVD